MKKNILHIDIETFSSADLTTVGVYAYVAAPDFEVLMIAYAFGDDEPTVVDLAQGQTIPLELRQAINSPITQKWAHNAEFEIVCLAAAGYDIVPEQWHCTAALASAAGYPSSLAEVSKALSLGADSKSAEGKALIKYFCRPTAVPVSDQSTLFRPRRRRYPFDDPTKWSRFVEYCRQDVVAERAVHRRLSYIETTPTERQVYLEDLAINGRGVCIDKELVEAAIAVADIDKANKIARMRELTGLSNPNSLPQLKRWLGEKTKKNIISLTKNDLPELIATAGEGVAEVLQLRSSLAKTSIKKYNVMRTCTTAGRARGMFKYLGAGRTGRWSGRLVQLQNVPRTKEADLDSAIGIVKSKDAELIEALYGDISTLLSGLIRTALVAAEGKSLVAADYSAIEARVIAWLAGERWRIDIFNTHGKIYEASASKMFNVPLEEVTKDSPYRDKGKIAELALGYGGGVKALESMGGEAMGLSEEEMQEIVDAWRKASPAIVGLWREVEEAALEVVAGRGERRAARGRLLLTMVKRNLCITLPSGRSLYYASAKLGPSRFGGYEIQYKGVAMKAWGQQHTYGGKLVENIIQAIARDVLAEALIRLRDRAPQVPVIMHVHDEVVCECDTAIAEYCLALICDIMSESPAWAQDLRLPAEGFITQHYKKG